jgi:hypothetical protein
MNICDYLNPQAAHILVILATGLVLLMVIRLLQGRPVFTWRDVVALSLIFVWTFYFHTHRSWWFGWKDYRYLPLLNWKDIFGDKFC